MSNTLRFLRFLGMVVILLVVVLAAALDQPEWARDLGLEPCIQMALAYRPLWLQEDPNREPGPASRAMDRRYVAKGRIIVELLDGRLTLFEAAALFRRLNAEYPVLTIWPDWRGDCEEEQLCWGVIEWAVQTEARLRSGSLDDSEVRVRLMEELRRHKERYGKVLLPEAPLVNYNAATLSD
jgi:hypothetical protein